MAKGKAKSGKNDVQVPLWHALQGDWQAPDPSTFPQWPEHGRVSLDVETRDDKIKTLGPGVRRGGKVVGYSFAIEDGFRTYVPLFHGGGDNVANPMAALEYLRDQGKRFKGVLVGANLQYDLDYLAQLGIHFSPKWFRDVQIADPLIWELHESYSLDNIAKRRGFAGKEQEELFEAAKNWGLDPKQELWKLPGRHVFKYACADVTLPLEILRKQEREIEEQGLQEIFDLESRVLPVLLKMRRRGVLIDQEHLGRVETFAIIKGGEALAEVRRLTGRTLVLDDVMKPGAVAPVLESIGVKLDETSLGKPNIDKDLLDKLPGPVPRLIARARRLYKLKNTFVASVRDHMTDGRLHCTFNQLRGSSSQDEDLVGEDEEKGARYGRLSSCDLNIQQQLSRDHKADVEDGLTYAQMWRAIYLPEPGMLWCANDFSQQEPRVLTHYAELCGCKKAREFGDMYRAPPVMVDGKLKLFDTYDGLSLMTRTKRTASKLIYLGLSYSMGPPKLCHTLGLPTVWRIDSKTGRMREYAGAEGDALFKTFHQGAPFIRQLDYMIRDAVQECGYIKTLLGRHVHFPKLDIPRKNPWTGKEENYDWAQKGLNRLIQGSSGDQVKKAIVDLDDAGHYLQIQVHDEVDGSVKDQAEGHQMADTMRNSVKLTVPMRVDSEFGKSWGHSMGYKG
jgi:DNA polymerase I-like protein with 3'-5' exonuclease and polymerase domains